MNNRTIFDDVDVTYAGILQAGVTTQGQQNKAEANRKIDETDSLWYEKFNQLPRSNNNKPLAIEAQIVAACLVGGCLLSVLGQNDLMAEYNEKFQRILDFKLPSSGHRDDFLKIEQLYKIRLLVLKIVEVFKPGAKTIEQIYPLMGDELAKISTLRKKGITSQPEQPKANNSQDTLNSIKDNGPSVAELKVACEKYKKHLENSKPYSFLFYGENSNELLSRKISFVNSLQIILNNESCSETDRKALFNLELTKNSYDIANQLAKSRDNYLMIFLKSVGVVGAAILGLAGLGVGAYFAGKYAKEKLFSVHGEEFVHEVLPSYRGRLRS